MNARQIAWRSWNWFIWERDDRLECIFDDVFFFSFVRVIWGEKWLQAHTLPKDEIGRWTEHFMIVSCLFKLSLYVSDALTRYFSSFILFFDVVVVVVVVVDNALFLILKNLISTVKQAKHFKEDALNFRRHRYEKMPSDTLFFRLNHNECEQFTIPSIISHFHLDHKMCASVEIMLFF